ncbi:MAG: hypothetical protein NZ895_03340 [Archaeoglobaceae archaeon]|nr:hypothetical protein [Archaeoglobaceae archaeon]MCX8152086.1 hypothetical protein [Archaeoglobaceae archaeon]MDW8013521.1 hypothetical protein [Archaeoglobaceae archaeon]
MTVVVSFRVPKEIKRKMDELKGKINWSKEVREFIEKKIKEYERISTVEEIEKLIRSLPEVPEGTASRYVREDRDSS